ncbi:MAG TPA: hypothetical protein VFK32_08775, partial [Tepidiformaceae bacterium]|nr:hypothetical protein [Tepidiformaceae bacterium]
SLDDALVERLRARAKRNGRSLEAEVRQILDAAATAEDDRRRRMDAFFDEAQRIRESFGDRIFSDSTDLIREDRDSR